MIKVYHLVRTLGAKPIDHTNPLPIQYHNDLIPDDPPGGQDSPLEPGTNSHGIDRNRTMILKTDTKIKEQNK